MKITRVFNNEIIFEDDSNTIKDCVINAISKDADLHGADLHGADLHGADLHGAYLHGAYLRGADLGYAYLGDADLHDAYLGDADLHDADLHGADLHDADLHGAYLRGANLRGANLHDANLGGADLGYAYLGDADLGYAYLGDADLHDAYLRGAKNIPFIPFACPSDGEFIGWKKVSGKLVRLLIPSDARRSSATSNKCRCDKAKVLEITYLDGSNPIESITNFNYAVTKYVVGEMVFPDSFDENRWDECSHGIHFFINKQEAINY